MSVMVRLSEDELTAVLNGLRLLIHAWAAHERGSRIVHVPEHIEELLPAGLSENLFQRILRTPGQEDG